jgi:hypothetical protein
MEILVYGNKLKLENGNIYNYRKKSNNSKKWIGLKLHFQ